MGARGPSGARLHNPDRLRRAMLKLARSPPLNLSEVDQSLRPDCSPVSGDGVSAAYQSSRHDNAVVRETLNGIYMLKGIGRPIGANFERQLRAT